MATIDQDQQLHQARAAVRKKGVESCSRGPAGIKHVVDEHDLFTLYGKTNFRFLHHGLRAQGRKVVTIERNIERADGNLLLFDLLNHFAQPLGDGNSTTADSDQSQSVDTTVFFQDFMSQAYQRSLNLRTRHQLGFLPQRCFTDRVLLNSHAANTSSKLVAVREYVADRRSAVLLLMLGSLCTG